MLYTGPELTKAYPTDAGFDLVSPEKLILRPREIAFVETETRISIPNTHVGLVCPRSGLGKRGIGIVNAPGIIDPGYNGRIGITLINHTDTAYTVHPGDRIAQLIIVEMSAWASRLSPQEFENATLYHDRGGNGFGSSGR